MRASHIIILCFSLFMFSSCARTQGMLLIMEANFFNTRGFFTEAIASYLRALAHDEAVPYAEYGLGSVYFSLGESAAAMERYRSAMRSLRELNREDPELRHRIYYNMGIIYFEQSEYHEAVNAFRNALRVDGSRVEAKRNLELSLLAFNRISPQPPDAAGAGEGEGAGRERAEIFEYLRRMNQEQWRNREWPSEDDWQGPDH